MQIAMVSLVLFFMFWLPSMGKANTNTTGRPMTAVENSTFRSLSFRIKPKMDLKAELIRVSKDNNIKAGVIISGVGSLEAVNLRLAGSDKAFKKTEKFEIVSITGTVSENGLHVHVAVADSSGQVFGGHLLEGNLIYTTAELVILEQKDLEFLRLTDPTYGYKELEIKRKN